MLSHSDFDYTFFIGTRNYDWSSYDQLDSTVPNAQVDF